MLRAPLRVFSEHEDLLRAMVRAEHRQRRQQHGQCQQVWRRPFEKRLQAQPEIKADAGMRPRHGQQYELDRDHVRPYVPINKQRRRIIERRAIGQSQPKSRTAPKWLASQSGMLKPRSS